MTFISPAGEPFRAEDGSYPSRAWFDQADQDHDGKLTSSEMRADTARFFKLLDVDGDGWIAGSEIERYEREVAPEVGFDPTAGGPPPGFSPPGGGPPGGGPPGGGPGGGAPPRFKDMPRGAGLFSIFNVPEPIMQADVNFTGSVSVDELQRATTRQFRALDANNRGYLLFDDLPSTPVEKMGKRLRRR